MPAWGNGKISPTWGLFVEERGLLEEDYCLTRHTLFEHKRWVVKQMSSWKKDVDKILVVFS